MVRWVACDHVVDSPVVTLEVFATSSTYWFEYGLSVSSRLFPFFTAMPISHCSLHMRYSMALCSRTDTSLSLVQCHVQGTRQGLTQELCVGLV
jgi:hypothetical protein